MSFTTCSAGAFVATEFFLISTSMWGQDELQTLHYAIMLNCSMGADGGHSVLASLLDGALAVLGLVDPGADQSADDILAELDRIAEVIDLDRLALTGRAGGADVTADRQLAMLKLIGGVSVAFWGFAT